MLFAEVFASFVRKECFVSVKWICWGGRPYTIWVPCCALSHETFGELPQGCWQLVRVLHYGKRLKKAERSPFIGTGGCLLITSRLVQTGIGRVDFEVTREVSHLQGKKHPSFLV